MQFAQSSAIYLNYSLQFAIKDLHDIGYQGIEIWGGRPHMYRHDLDEQMDDIIGLLKKLNMKVCNFIPAQFHYPSILCSTNEVVRQDSVEYIKVAIDNAIKVGAPSISLCPNMIIFDENTKRGWKKLIKSYKEIEEYNQDKNLVLLIEPAHRYESNLILTIEDCFRMFDELKSDKFGILLDTGHCNINREDFMVALLKCKDIPLHIHIDDNNGDCDAHLIPGKGNVDFKSLIKALKEINYQGFISAELSSTYIMDPRTACEETLCVLKEMFK